MIKHLLFILLTLIITLSLTSCSTNAYKQQPRNQNVPQHEGGIVGTGHTVNCNSKENKNKSECYGSDY